MSKTLLSSKVIDQLTDSVKQSIDWVGIESMTLPIYYRLADEAYRTAAQIDIAVSLDDGSFKGIDMAELYFNTQEILADQELDFASLNDLANKLLEVHSDRTKSFKIEVSFDFFKEQDTLRSKETGIRSYPVSLELVNIDGELACYINFEIMYASTCPCSEAASRRENLAKFKEFFANNSTDDFEAWYLDQQNTFAHPHAQKSQAKFSLSMADVPQNPCDYVLEMITELEAQIQTAVHAAVRQEDEAAFTTKMGDNLIFIEDAAKQFKEFILGRKEIMNSICELTHYESIHPHNAKAIFTT